VFIWKNPRPSRVRNLVLRVFARREMLVVPEATHETVQS
jgi:hypothetical protein